jgi:hypothetical protein
MEIAASTSRPQDGLTFAVLIAARKSRRVEVMPSGQLPVKPVVS